MKMKVLHPQHMGEITPRNEGNMGSHGKDHLCQLFEILEVGAHSRFAVGCSSLPLGVPVEVGADTGMKR